MYQELKNFTRIKQKNNKLYKWISCLFGRQRRLLSKQSKQSNNIKI